MRYIQLKGLRDLAMLVTSAAPIGVVQHLSIKDGHLYFIIAGTLREIFLYFVKLKEEIDGRYIVYNTLSGEISFNQRVRTDPYMNSIPILEIVNQDLLPKELVETVNTL